MNRSEIFENFIRKLAWWNFLQQWLDNIVGERSDQKLFCLIPAPRQGCQNFIDPEDEKYNIYFLIEYSNLKVL